MGRGRRSCLAAALCLLHKQVDFERLIMLRGGTGEGQKGGGGGGGRRTGVERPAAPPCCWTSTPAPTGVYLVRGGSMRGQGGWGLWEGSKKPDNSTISCTSMDVKE